MTGWLLLAACPAAILALCLYRWLREAGFVRGWAVGLSGITLLQGGIVAALLYPGHTLWFALADGVALASVLALARREDIRRIVALAGSLSLVQLADPLGGLVAAGLIPTVLAVTGAARPPRQAVGFYSLLLFVPVMTAAALFYAASRHMIPFPFVPAVRLPHGWSLKFVAPALAVIPVLPALIACRPRAEARLMLAAICVPPVAAMLAASMGTLRDPVALLAAAAPATALMLAGEAERPWQAARLAGICTGLSWAVLGLMRL